MYKQAKDTFQHGGERELLHRAGVGAAFVKLLIHVHKCKETFRKDKILKRKRQKNKGFSMTVWQSDMDIGYTRKLTDREMKKREFRRKRYVHADIIVCQSYEQEQKGGKYSKEIPDFLIRVNAHIHEGKTSHP